MTNKVVHSFINYFNAIVWIVNGLFCKVFNLVPRHQQIIIRILGSEHSRFFTVSIGCSEIFMAVWILSNIKTKLNATTQIAIVAIMNILEFFLAPDLLLWGKLNALFAFLFILVVYFNEFYLNKKLAQ